MAEKKKLYIHIGTVKTGTTALQHFFARNRQILQEHDICYPESKRQDAHHRLAWSLHRAEGKAPASNWPPDLASPEGEWHFLRKQCVCRNILLSSERFSRLSSQSMLTMKRWFANFEVKVIVYWRRRDHLETSWHNQLIKAGEHTFRSLPARNLTQKKQLDDWAAMFGQKNILLRPYEKSQLHQGDVLADFMHHVFGLELPGGFSLSEKEINERLHRVVLEYKRNFNHLNLSLKQKRETMNPLKAVSAVFVREGRENFPVLPPERRLALIQQYAEENAEIAREYLGRKDGILFFEPLPDPDEEWEAYDDLKAEDAQTINHYLGQHYPEVLDIVVQGILMSIGYGNNIHEAALKIFPGIEPEHVVKILAKTLATPCDHAELKFQEKLHDLYGSQTWKVGSFLKRLYDYLPIGLNTLLMETARFVYQKMKWT